MNDLEHVFIIEGNTDEGNISPFNAFPCRCGRLDYFGDGRITVASFVGFTGERTLNRMCGNC